MYEKFKELLINKDKEGLKKLIEKADAAELAELILPRLRDDNAARLLGDILKYFPATENAQSTRRKLVEAVLKSIRKAQIPNSHANALVNRIIQDFPKYSKLQLVRLVDSCLNSIRCNDDDFFCWRDMLPVILQVLEGEKYINYKGTEVSGPEYKTLIIKSICNQLWVTGILTSLAMMFAEIRMEQTEHGTVIRALCDKISEVNHSELPPLVHQLLRLSNNQDGKLVIGTLQKYFNNLYAQAPNESPDAISMDGIVHISVKEIQETESTILYYIHQSALLNHSSMKDFIRNLKSITNAPEFVLHPFSMAVLLLVSDIYEDQIFDIIKQAFTRKIQDDEKRNGSAWLREVLPDNWEIMEIMNQIVENSNKDRHLVIKGLVDLAFVLMDTKSKENEENLLHEIGIKVIQKLVKKRHEIGKVVLERLTSNIIEKGTSVSQYTDCLAYMCRKSVLIVLDSQVWISTLLDHLLLIPGEAATQVLHATLPLMRVSTNIRDSLVLILRKVLYRPGIEIRQMGVTGFLQFLTNLKIPPFSLSQSSSMNTTSSGSIFTQATVERGTQQLSRPNARNNAAFCHEILGILQRCFSHEVEVRQHLYKGLHNAVSSNPELAEHVIDMLLTHLNDFYESEEDVKPPLKFHECCNVNGPEAVLQEPIGDLIFALQKIYCDMALKDLSSIDQLSMVLESLCRRMAQIELEHFHLDDQTDLLDNVPKAQQKVISLKLAVTTLEALMAFRVNAWSPESQGVAQSVYSLFKCYHVFVEFSKRVNKPKKGEGKSKKNKNATDTTINKKTRARVLKLPHTIMDIQTIKKMITLLYQLNVSWATNEQTAYLKKKSEFHQYVLHISIQIFHDAKLLRNYERHIHREKHKKDYIEIGELLYKEVIGNLDHVRQFDEEVAILCLECFKELCDLMSTNFSMEFSEFLGAICEIEPAQGLATQINCLLSALQVLIEAYYGEEVEEDSSSNRIPLVLFETIFSIVQNTPSSRIKMDKMFEWLQKLSILEDIDAPIAIIILQLITIIEERDVGHGKVLDEMALELCKKFGTIDDSELTVKEVHKIFNDATMSQAHSVFNNALKNKINNAAWTLGRLKAEQIVVGTSGIGDERHREELKGKERSLCRQLCYAIQTLESLANATITPGPNTESTFKNLQHLYSVLTSLTKYFSSKSSPQNPAFQAVKFIQVVQLAGKSLKTTFYNLITYTEENQNSGRKSDVHALRNKVLKETKFIPKVVYDIEQFNKEILALGKKTGIPLESYLKHSITRDFRIKHPELAEGLERLDITQIQTQNTQGERNAERHLSLSESETTNREDNDSEAPAAKRPRQEDGDSSSIQ